MLESSKNNEIAKLQKEIKLREVEARMSLEKAVTTDEAEGLALPAQCTPPIPSAQEEALKARIAELESKISLTSSIATNNNNEEKLLGKIEILQNIIESERNANFILRTKVMERDTESSLKVENEGGIVRNSTPKEQEGKESDGKAAVNGDAMKIKDSRIASLEQTIMRITSEASVDKHSAALQLQVYLRFLSLS
jgi:hypothetical protein